MGIFTNSATTRKILEYVEMQQKFAFSKRPPTITSFFRFSDKFRLSFTSKVDSLLGERINI